MVHCHFIIMLMRCHSNLTHLYQLAFGKIGFVIHRFTSSHRTYQDLKWGLHYILQFIFWSVIILKLRVWWEKNACKSHTDVGLVSRIYSNSTIKRQITQFKNGLWIWTYISPKIYKWSTNLKKCLTLLVIREMLIKTIMRYHFIPIR